MAMTGVFAAPAVTLSRELIAMFDPSWVTLPLSVVAARLAAIRHPEELFGPLGQGGTAGDDPAGQLRRVHAIYRHLALCVHPDRHAGDPHATTAFSAVQRIYTLARQQISDGRHSASGTATISSRRRQYIVGEILAQGEIAVLYQATCRPGHQATVTRTDSHAPAPTAPVILKVARDAEDNDLLANEASVLRALLRPNPGSLISASSLSPAINISPAPVPPYIPRLLESFICQDASGVDRAVSVFSPVTTAAGPLDPRDFFTLTELRAAYPAGLDPRHIGWIWRRLLIALEHAHARGIVHGGILPEHVLIHPADHGLLLVDWCASVQLDRVPDGRIAVVSPDYQAWYPARVLAGRTPTPALDLLMGLRCMVYLLGGDPLSGTLPASTPGPLQAYLRGALASAHAGQADAARLYGEFSHLLASLWGRRRFVPLPMPARPARSTGASYATAGARP
jgi:serine/threonine protein kinase